MCVRQKKRRQREKTPAVPHSPITLRFALSVPDALEKTVAVLRTELAATRAQGEKLASAVNEVKSAPRGE